MSTDLHGAAVRGLRMAQVLPDAKAIGTSDIAFRSCSSRWDECEQGDVFVALVEAERDGHDHVHQAIECGAQAIVTERLLAIDHPQFIVEDTRLAFGKLCHALAGNPCRRLETIGVTGSDGKTTTAHLVESILRTNGRQTGLITSIQPVEAHLGDDATEDRRQEYSNPAAIANVLASMAMNSCSHAVLETNSWQLASRICSGMELDVAIVTNLRRDAAAIHGSVENYLKAELRIFEYLKPTGFGVINADDPLSQRFLDSLNVPVLTFGIHQAAEIQAKIISEDRSGQTFLLTAGDQSVPVQTSICGKQHVYNCLAAAAALLPQGLRLTDIAEGISQCHPAGRMERVDCGQNFGVWIDAASSPNQIATAIHALKNVVPGKIWCVASIHDAQASRQRRRLGQILERCHVQSILTQRHPVSQIDYEPYHQVLDGMESPSSPQVIPDRFRAIEWALTQAQPDDAVLITGCGERPIAIIGDRDWTVTDKDVCQAWLYDRSSFSVAGPNSSPPDSQIFEIDDYR